MAVTDALKEKIKQATTADKTKGTQGSLGKSVRAGVSKVGQLAKTGAAKTLRGGVAAAPYAAAGSEIYNIPAYQREAQYDADVGTMRNFQKQSPEVLAGNLRGAQAGLEQYRAETQRLQESGEGGRFFATGEKNLDRREDNIAARERSIRLMQMLEKNQQPAIPEGYGERGVIGTLMGGGGKEPPMVKGTTVAGDNDGTGGYLGGDDEEGDPGMYGSTPKVNPKTGEVSMTTPDGRGDVRASQDSYNAIRAQAQDPEFLDRMIGRSQQGGDEARLQAVSGAARAAIARGENVNLDRVFGKSGFGKWSDAQEADYQIDLLRKKLANPGRGLNQSGSSFMQEQAEKRGIRQQIAALSKRRDSLLESDAEAADTAARREETLYERLQDQREFGLDAAKERRAARESAADLDAANTKVFTDYEDQMIEADNSDDPFRQKQAVRQKMINVARNQFLSRGGDFKDPKKIDAYYKGPQGQLAERATKEFLISSVNDEQGWFTKLFGVRPSQADIENIDFEGWEVGEGDMIVPFTDNRAFRRSDPANSDLYAYMDSLPAGVTFAIKTLIARDNPKQRDKIMRSLRRGQ